MVDENKGSVWGSVGKVTIALTGIGGLVYGGRYLYRALGEPVSKPPSKAKKKAKTKVKGTGKGPKVTKTKAPPPKAEEEKEPEDDEPFLCPDGSEGRLVRFGGNISILRDVKMGNEWHTDIMIALNAGNMR